MTVSPKPTPPAAPLVLYDGDCGFCHKSIGFILRHERRPELMFAALSSDLGHAELVRHGLPADFDRSLVLIEDGVAYRYSTAVLRIARYLKRPWRWAWAARFIPRPMRDFAYLLVAKYRGKLGGLVPTCEVPKEATRGRFVG